MQSFEDFEAISSVFTAICYLAGAAVTLWIGLEFRGDRKARQKEVAPAVKMQVRSAAKIIYPKFKPSRAA